MGQMSVKVISKNPKAYHDYFIEDKFETGIELCGTEVKSIRQGNVNLKDAYCIIKDAAAAKDAKREMDRTMKDRSRY